MHFQYAIVIAFLSQALAGDLSGSMTIPHANKPPTLRKRAPGRPPSKTYHACNYKDVTYQGCNVDTDCQITSTKRTNIGKVGIPVLDVLFTLGDGFCDTDQTCGAKVAADSPLMDMCKEMVNAYIPRARVLNACQTADGGMNCDMICPDTEEKCHPGTYSVPCGSYNIATHEQSCLQAQNNQFNCPGTKLPSEFKCPAPPTRK